MKEKIVKVWTGFSIAALAGMTVHAVGFLMLIVDMKDRERQEILDYVRSQKKGGAQ